MYRWTGTIARKLSKTLHDRSGVAGVVFAVSATALIGMSGFAVDVGIVLSARQALQANTNAAVLSGAYQWSKTGGTESAALNTAQNWNVAHPVSNVSGITSTASAVCVSPSQTSGLPTCGNGVNNTVVLKQTGTVPTYFIKLLGFTSWTVSASAAAAKAGNPTKPLNVMFVLDTTQSMATTSDNTGCKIPGKSNPTRLNCALYGVQLVLKQLDPQYAQVGLMVFPGMSKTWTPCGSPSVTKYGATGITYQVIHNALDTNFATAPGKLNDTSSFIKTVGDGTSVTGCLQAPGGEGTFYGQVMSAAQAALQSQGSSTRQNVIILLSDGEANASSGMDSTYAATACSPTSVCSRHIAQQCNQAVVAAQNATTSGTWVYAIAYGAGGAGTGCPTYGSGSSAVYDSPNGKNASVWTPCTALQKIASDQARFYSTSSSCSSTNAYTDVATAFQQVGSTLTQPRLVIY
ncbi:TadE/TadG family type IV pilus assembly protein [Bradyrhizobium erythrophlei]|uniref:Putative Flp pilus-assembly TadE/G-like n=1 Tax=Bradyrhizobium erythrophlei TaxID=1437360 RepID=A0A1H5JF05_9BRAD|nr:TadE/TadG family type IV pilus assembly protein [Bradyrhizobium erythrophlei]SEE51034.1 Putative Flp pilus-assembly TadE/G-like [Bradyrhizobium erythrophlei]